MMTAAEAAKIEAELRRLLTFVERVNDDVQTKLENLIRYSLDEAQDEAKRAAAPPLPIMPLDEDPPPDDCRLCGHPRVIHGGTGVCQMNGCACPDYKAPAR